jgi:hypothetical protein
MGPVSQHVAEFLHRKLVTHRVVVWFDRERAFQALPSSLAMPGTTVLQLADSWLRLREQADRWLLGTKMQAEGESASLLIYLPVAKPPEKEDVLLPFWKAGGKFGDGVAENLRELAREALKDRIPDARLEAILDNPHLTLADLDRLGEEGASGAGAGLLGVIFETTAGHEIAARLLADDKALATIAERGAEQELRQFLRDAFEFSSESSDLHAMRENLARYVLLGDFLEVAGLTEAPEALRGVARPAQRVHIEACRRTCRILREMVPYRERYAAIARGVEAALHLEDLAISSDKLNAVETFRFVDATLLRSVGALVREGQIEHAVNRVKSRAAGFWAVAEPNFGFQWQVAGLALELLKQARRTLTEVEGFRDASLRTWIEAYATDVAAGKGGSRLGAWHRMDQAHRLLERELTRLEEEVEVGDLVQDARAAHRKTDFALAEGFQKAVCRSGFDFQGAPPQMDVFRRYLRPALESGRVAYFLVDGLRYEMGADLASALARDADVECHFAVATLPTITEVGMAALLPGAEDGLVLKAGKTGSLVPEVKGQALESSPARMKFLTAQVGPAADLILGDVLGKTPRALARRLEGKALVVVRSWGIDQYGEEGGEFQARKAMSEVIDDLCLAARRLANLGFERQVFVADHGYLFSEELDEGMKIDPPGGETLCLHRRCWVGRGGRASDEFIRVKAAQLGLGGDLEFAFPNGLGAFRVAGGNLAYFHGGFCLQELVIPVITARLSQQADRRRGAVAAEEIALTISRDRITNRIFVVAATYRSLVAEPIRVRGVVRFEGQRTGEVATALYGFDPATKVVALEPGRENALTFLLAPESPRSGHVEITLEDPATGVIRKNTGPTPLDLTH